MQKARVYSTLQIQERRILSIRFQRQHPTRASCDCILSTFTKYATRLGIDEQER